MKEEPGQEKVKALYDYSDDDPQYLKFKYAFRTHVIYISPGRAGDIIIVTNKSDSDWWEGTIKGRSGAFPANCTQRTR